MLIRRHSFLLAAPRFERQPIETISHQPGYYHAWPTLIRRRSGELIGAYSGGREHHVCPFGRLELTRSLAESRTWSCPQIAMDTPIDDRDAGLCEAASGALLLNTFTSLAYEKILAAAKDWDPARLARWRAVQRATIPAQRQSLLGAIFSLPSAPLLLSITSSGSASPSPPPWLARHCSPSAPLDTTPRRLVATPSSYVLPPARP